mgnify:FL=1|jgi:hypothetical protein
MNNEFELAIKDFIRNGGVVLAANDNRNIVGIRGTFEEISEKFIKALVNMSVTIIKKNPKDFEILVAATMSHLLALAKIAEKKYDAPQLSKDVIYRVAMTLCDKDAARYAALSTKHMLEEMEDEA